MTVQTASDGASPSGSVAFCLRLERGEVAAHGWCVIPMPATSTAETSSLRSRPPPAGTRESWRPGLPARATAQAGGPSCSIVVLSLVLGGEGKPDVDIRCRVQVTVLSLGMVAAKTACLNSIGGSHVIPQ